MKILHIGDTAGVPLALRNIDRENGNKSDIVRTYPHPFKYPTDYEFSINGKNIPSLLESVKLFRLCLQYDRIHYHKTPILCGLDIVLLKKLFKKYIYIHYHGTDIRNKKQPYVHAKIADKVFVSTPDLLEYVPSAKWLPNRVIESDIPVLLRKEYLDKRDGGKPFVILHTPTNPSLKGTSYVNDAINKLKHDGYNIEYKQITNSPHTEILKEMAMCDLYIDQLILGFYGVSSLECAYMGVPAVCFVSSKFESPFINATTENIYEVLKEVLSWSPDKLAIIGVYEKQYYTESRGALDAIYS